MNNAKTPTFGDVVATITLTAMIAPEEAHKNTFVVEGLDVDEVPKHSIMHILRSITKNENMHILTKHSWL